MPHPFAGLALHTWTLDTTPFADALAAAKRAGFDAVEIRRIDFTRAFAAGQTNAQVLDTVRGCGLPVSAIGVEYGWIFAQGDERARLFDVFRETCANAIALNCDLLMSALGPGAGTIDDAVRNLREAADIAGDYRLRLTLEYQVGHPIVTTLDVLRDIIAAAGSVNAGLLLDTYHLQRCGRTGRGFEDVPAQELSYVQFSDVPDAPLTTTPATDRLAPGRGIIPWGDVLTLLAEKGYSGYLSYEAPNPVHWTRDPVEAAREGADAMRALLSKTFA
jgi:sugar phosphate isomerase/epimerase